MNISIEVAVRLDKGTYIKLVIVEINYSFVIDCAVKYIGWPISQWTGQTGWGNEQLSIVLESIEIIVFSICNRVLFNLSLST